VGGSLVLRKAKNLPQVYLEQGERSERVALCPPILGAQVGQPWRVLSALDLGVTLGSEAPSLT